MSSSGETGEGTKKHAAAANDSISKSHFNRTTGKAHTREYELITSTLLLITSCDVLELHRMALI